MKRLFIISNRLPFKLTKEDNQIKFKPSEGGLATGLGSLEMNLEKHWVGWPGTHFESPEEEQKTSSSALIGLTQVVSKTLLFN